MSIPDGLLPTLGELAGLVEGRLRGGDAQRPVAGVATIDDATGEQITWLSDAKLSRSLATTRAAAVIMSAGVPQASVAVIEVTDPEEAIARVLERFAIPLERPARGVHPSASVGEDARIDPEAAVGPFVRIGSRASIAAGTVVHAGAFVGAGCRIGRSCEIHPNVYIGDRCVLGDRVVIKPGAVIGSDGFGFIFRQGRHRRIPHIGIVILEDDVEIGANACVDRAKVAATLIGRGTKIDNLVQVAHNCTLGPCCVLAGQVGLSGSVRVGAGVLIGGQAGVIHGLNICAGARLNAGAKVYKSIETPGAWSGFPARPHIEHNRTMASMRHVPDLIAHMKELTKRVAELEAAMHDRKTG